MPEQERELIVCTCGEDEIKGPWSTLIDSAQAGGQAFYFLMWQTESDAPVGAVVDLAVGPPADEKIIREDLSITVKRHKESCFYVSSMIPAGERVAIRVGSKGPASMDFYIAAVSANDGPLFLYE
jgi:hypothetical protein